MNRVAVGSPDYVRSMPLAGARRELVFLDRATDARCEVCGFGFEVPAEAVRFVGALAHVGCVSDPGGAIRGGA